MTKSEKLICTASLFHRSVPEHVRDNIQDDLVTISGIFPVYSPDVLIDSSRTRKDIVSTKPELVLITTYCLDDYILGFVKKLSDNLQKAKLEVPIALCGKSVCEGDVDRYYESGVNALFDEQLSYEEIGCACIALVQNEPYHHQWVRFLK